VFSALEVFYENALYKFTFDIDIDIVGGDVKHCSNRHALCYSLLLQYTDVPTTEINVSRCVAGTPLLTTSPPPCMNMNLIHVQHCGVYQGPP